MFVIDFHLAPNDTHGPFLLLLLLLFLFLFLLLLLLLLRLLCFSVISLMDRPIRWPRRTPFHALRFLFRC